MLDTSLRAAVVTTPDELDQLSPGSVVKLSGLRKPVYRECTGTWMSTLTPGTPVTDYVSDPDFYPANVVFRAEPLDA